MEYSFAPSHNYLVIVITYIFTVIVGYIMYKSMFTLLALLAHFKFRWELCPAQIPTA